MTKVTEVRDDPRSGVRTLLRGFLVLVTGTLWMFAAHLRVWAYFRSCDASAGPGGGFIALAVLAVSWVVFVAASAIALGQLRKAARRGRRAVLVAAGLVVLGMALVMWGYWAVVIPAMTDPVYLAVRCGGR